MLLNKPTVNENIIGAPKMRNNFDDMIWTVFPILRSQFSLYSIASPTVITPYIFCINSLLLLLIALSL